MTYVAVCVYVCVYGVSCGQLIHSAQEDQDISNPPQPGIFDDDDEDVADN